MIEKLSILICSKNSICLPETGVLKSAVACFPGKRIISVPAEQGCIGHSPPFCRTKPHDVVSVLDGHDVPSC